MLDANAATPTIRLRDTEATDTYHAGIIYDGTAVTLQLASLNVTTGEVYRAPVEIALHAPTGTLQMLSDGKVGIGMATEDIAQELTVGGDIQVTGNIGCVNVRADGVYYAGEDEGVTGTLVVTGTWNGGSSGSRTLTFAGGILTGVT
jgi:hypothetical protein